jgi:quinol-cytochrome oxidoreductase complex cytochrome b subunit/mono/diheme cytochrome c family protein
MSNGFFESRTAWGKLKESLLLEPLLGGSRWAAAFGSLLLFSFVVQVITGILLSMNYSQSVESAWPSVNYIMTEVRFGSLVRSMHHWGSSAMVILLLIHLVQVFVWGAYKKPREFTWMVGVALLLLTLILAFTGYLLPWDQKAYWATKVGLGIASTVPGIGDWIKTLLQGGSSMGNLTLTRFFSIHVFILPGLLIALVVVHLYLFRVHGVTPAWWESERQLEAEKEPFWPGQAFKDAVFALAFLLALVAWSHWWPAPLEAKADPSLPYEARPEWYFMFLFYLLQFFKGPYEVVGTFVLPALFFLILFFWPFLDRNRARDPRRRPLAIGLLALSTFGLIGLTVFAIATDVRLREPKTVLANALPPAQAGPLQQLDVAALFSSNCMACHGVDGNGDKVRPGMPNIPDFTSLSWQLGHTDLHLTQGILEGKPPQMPAYRDKLRPEEAAALAIYVRAFVTTPHPDVVPTPAGATPKAVAAATPATEVHPSTAPVDPAELYISFCLACHDKDGRGGLVKVSMPKIPDFTDKPWRQKTTDDAIVQAVLNGKEPFMRPFKDKLNEAEARALAKYVHSFPAGIAAAPTQPPATMPVPQAAQPPAQPAPRKEAVAATPAPAQARSPEASERITQAASQFRQYCLACHGTDGRGTAVRDAMPTIPDLTDPGWQTSRPDPRLVISILDGSGKLMPPFRDHISRAQAQALAAYVRAFGPQRKPTEAAPATGDLDERMRQLQDQWRELERRIKNLPQ